MRKDRYENFNEWKQDMNRINAHPNDKHLLQHVTRCVENSSPEIKQEVKDYLIGLSLETNPWFVLKQIAKESPGHSLFVKNNKDPWFEV